jgi:hypothetical protein
MGYPNGGMSLRLPPPDPHESLGDGPAEGTRMAAPAAIFMTGPPSPEADRLSDAILDFRPGALFVAAQD